MGDGLIRFEEGWRWSLQWGVERKSSLSSPPSLIAACWIRRHASTIPTHGMRIYYGVVKGCRRQNLDAIACKSRQRMVLLKNLGSGLVYMAKPCAQTCEWIGRLSMYQHSAARMNGREAHGEVRKCRRGVTTRKRKRFLTPHRTSCTFSETVDD